MAEERSFSRGRQEGTGENLDERLSAFYGSALPEQPLPASSWQHLHRQLRVRQRPVRRLAFPRWSGLRRDRQAVPWRIYEAFRGIAFDARVRVNPSMLRYSLKAGAREPSVRVSTFGREQIRLVLPSGGLAFIEPPMLDVLLASGLARLHLMRGISRILSNLLLSGLTLLAGLCWLALWLRHLPLPGFFIAIVLWAVVAVLLHLRGLRLALRADVLMVQWLGRDRACDGLHMLADRSRRTRQIRWGEPSLADRIARVCGTQVPVADERLTMAR